MKKFLALLTAAVLCLGLIPAAMGEASLQQVYQFTTEDSTRFIYDSNFLEIGSYQENAVAAMDGTLLTGKDYYRISYEDGYFVVINSKGSKSGVLNTEGQIIVPIEYDDVQALSDVWAAGVNITLDGTKEDHDYFMFGDSDKYGKIKTVDLYNIKEGKKVDTLTRDQYADAEAKGEYLNIYNRATNTVHLYDGNYNLVGNSRSVYTFPDEETKPYESYYEDGKYGLKDAEDNVLISPRFDYIQDIQDGLVKVQIGDYYGVCDLSGNMLIPAEYDGFESTYGSKPADYPQDTADIYGYIALKKDNKTGYYSLKENAITAEPRYGSDENANNYGVSQLRKSDDDQYSIYAADGTDTKLEGYIYCTQLEYSLGRYYKVQNAEYRYGLVDRHGKEVLPCAYDTIDMSGDGRYVMTYDWESKNVTVYELTDEFVSGD